MTLDDKPQEKRKRRRKKEGRRKVSALLLSPYVFLPSSLLMLVNVWGVLDPGRYTGDLRGGIRGSTAEEEGGLGSGNRG